MAIINGTNFNDNDTLQAVPFLPFIQFFSRLDGTNLDDSIFGFGGNDILNGFNGNDILDGGTGVDVMNGGDGNDTYIVDNIGDLILNTTTFDPTLGEVNDSIGGVDTVNSSISYTLGASLENLNLTGAANINGTGNAKNNVINGTTGANTLLGGAGNDTLFGDNGNDILDGGTGADSMNGDDNDDTYFVDNVGDTAFESFNDSFGGVDTVNSSVSHTLGFGIENLNLTGNVAINGTGNANNNVINGNSANNTLSGLGGNDTISGGNGNDTYLGGDGNDTLTETIISFNAVDDGADVLDGGAGADTMNGGDGNDTYFVDNVGDVIAGDIDDVEGGTADLVNASITYTLGAAMENLTLTGADAINGTGNAKNNIINGNGANNTLSGLGGNDTISGGNGNDTYLGGDGNDTLTETIIDLNAIDDGADVLDGGAGADTMNGGDGNDTYFVDNVGDVIAGDIDDVEGGTADLVNASITYTLGAAMENLNLTGAAVNGTGNAKNNVINGNGGANVIDGGTGADTMNAGDGSDTYFVDNVGDVVSETFNDSLGGVDTVNSSVSFGPLGFGIENLNLTGVANINGGGNANNNVINGNAGINTLDGADGNDKLNGNAGNDVLNGGNGNDALNGGAGVDTMTGGLGNDIYFVNAATDAVIEAAGVGTGVDLVNSTISSTLGLNLENLTLLGAANLNGNGNTVNNVIRGNGGANILNGNAGHDKLFGNAGNDTLNGGTGSDTIDGGDGNDLIVGGAGTDNMTGGLGADTFDFNSVAESPTLGAFDTITNFTWSEGDKIDLVTIDADVTLAGNQAFGLAQLSFNSVTSLFTADVIGGADLSINLVGVQAGFAVNLDVIA